MSVRIYGIMSLVKMDEEDSMIIFSIFVAVVRIRSVCTF